MSSCVVKKIHTQIIESDSRIKLVNSAAGSGKTQILIKAGMYLSEKFKQNIIFLTKIGSVTDEITVRMTKNYGFSFEKSGNHFLAEKNNLHIEVANFDAFIDKQMRKFKIPMDGDAFNSKVDRLIQNLDKVTGIYMKNDQPINAILIDEIQDFDEVRIKFVTKLLNKLPDLRCIMVGDTLQTIFQQSIIDGTYSFNYLRTQLNPEYFEMTTCYRCPETHIKFVNAVMQPYQKMYGIRPIRSNNTDMINKPVLFQHGSVTKESERAKLAQYVVYIIDYILSKDSSIQLDDIVVLMNKTNANAVFEKIVVKLNEYYFRTLGIENGVVHYATKNDEGRMTINWDSGIKRTKLMSIHGDKGKGHKVVIVLGASEKSIPMAEFLYKTEELISQSVLNVAMTRSEKYLFIGMNSIPTRYIYDKLDTIVSEKLAYCSWDETTWPEDEFYKPLMEDFPSKGFKCHPERYTRRCVYTPTKSLMGVNFDICQEIHIADCLKNCSFILNDMKEESFGQRQFLPLNIDVGKRCILGITAEILTQRYMRLKTGDIEMDHKILVSYRQKNGDVDYVYTNNQVLLDAVFDNKMNNFVDKPTFWAKGLNDVKKSVGHIKSVRDLLIRLDPEEPSYILDDIFNRVNLKATLKEYFTDKPNQSFPIEFFWNLALFVSALSGHYKIASNFVYYNAFHYKVPNLFKNVEIYCDKYLIPAKKIIFQKKLDYLKRLSPNDDLLQQMNYKLCEDNQVYSYGILGISDTIYQDDDENWILHEMKCISNSDESKRKLWFFQALVYLFLCKKLPKDQKIDIVKFSVVNVLSGRIFHYDISDGKISFKKMMTIIMQTKGFPQKLIDYYL